MTVKLGADELRYMALFESLTGASVRDCLVKNNRITFVVKKGEIGLAIGKGGNKIKRAKQVMGKEVEVVEYSEDPEEFVKNVLSPARVKEVKIIERGGNKVAAVRVEEIDRGIAVGKNGRNIHRARALVQRHHGIQDISLL